MILDVVTTQLPVLDSDGNILYYCGGVPRAMMNILSCIEDDYEYIRMFVLHRNTNTYYSFEVYNKKFKNKTFYATENDMLAVMLKSYNLVLVIDSPSYFDWNLHKRQTIGLFQTWGTDPAAIGLAGVIANGTILKIKYPSLLNIGCLYDSDEFYPIPDVVKKPYALYVGRVDKDKNIKELISIWDEIYIKYQIKLKLIGPCNSKYITPIESSYCIEYIKTPMNSVQLNREYNECMFFIIPSKSESFGCVIIEALSTNTAVVGDGYIGAIQNFPELVPLYHGAYDGSKNKLKETIISFIDNNTIHITNPNSEKIVNNLFSINNNKHKVKELFRLCHAHPTFLT